MFEAGPRIIQIYSDALLTRVCFILAVLEILSCPWADTAHRGHLKSHQSCKFQKTLNGVWNTVKILKIGTPKIITVIVLQLEQLDLTVQYCVQKMQTE